MTETLSLDVARKLLLDHQRLHGRSHFGKGIKATLSAIEHLGYVQLDTLSVVQRAHLHTLWNRVDGFKPDHIDKLQRDGKIFEHWAHALALLPMRDYRFSLPMMRRIASGERHWYPKNKKFQNMYWIAFAAKAPLRPKISTISQAAKRCGYGRPQRMRWNNCSSKGN